MQKFGYEENACGRYVFGEIDDGFFVFSKGKNSFDIKAFYRLYNQCPSEDYEHHSVVLPQDMKGILMTSPPIEGER